MENTLLEVHQNFTLPTVKKEYNRWSFDAGFCKKTVAFEVTLEQETPN
jgi:hypothetical protein